MPLTKADISKAAERLGVEPCAIKAVVEVESSGSGFLPDGRPKILFEGHVFWRELAKRSKNPELLAREHPSLIYPKWTDAYYRGGAAEHERLKVAASIDEEAALCSTSWGLFQIMGFNHRAAGYANVREFVQAMRRDEATQLEAFCNFLRSEGLALFLVGRDWAGFARRYNGPGYARYQYDAKLQRAYERCVSRGGA